MAFHYWHNRGRPSKRQFVSLEGSYHGETLGALAVTDVAIFRDTYAPLLHRNMTVPSPDARGAAPGESARDVAVRAAAALDAHLTRHHASIAAFIVEPLVQGASGMAMHDPHYLARARELCTRHDVLLIADEIMTGFGRTGTLFACEQAGIAPDLLCLSKGITGGYLPLSCVLVTDAIFDAFYDDDVARAFLHSHSYTGNALACRAALAVLDIFRDDGVLAANRVKAARWTTLAAPLAAHPKVRGFRHIGMIWAFDVATDRADFARWCFAEGLAREILLRPLGRTLYFMPPYVVTDDEFALLVARTIEILDAA
jgi:adenosylmethionine---8-amino-7-oxononanoate aminotransferase